MKILDHHIAPQLLLMAVVDFMLTGASVFVVHYVGVALGADVALRSTSELVVSAVLLALAANAGLAAMGLYSMQQRSRIEGVLARMLVGLGAAAIGMASLDFFFDFVTSPMAMFLALMLAGALLGAARVVFARLVNEDVFRRRVLVYGAGSHASRLLELRRRTDQRGFKIVAFVPALGDRFVMNDSRVLSNATCPLRDYVQEAQIDEIVVAIDDRRRDFPVAELLACKLSGISVVDVLQFLERETGRIKVDMVNPAWLIFSEGFSRIGGNRWSFAALDLIVAGFVALLALPPALIAAVAILLDDGRPILYRQRRVGLNGQEFVLFKFRSMRKDAEAAGATWATRDDDRVTRVGKLLRKFRLDELPQLINVLRRDMSFVGPRPERPEFVHDLAQKIPYYHERHCVKPGLTGWAQLCYPYGASADDARAKLEYDMYYIKNRSLVFNLMILLQTVEVVLWQKGSR